MPSELTRNLPHDDLSSGLPSSARLEAFSDGVFAVAITVLVLNLRAPNRPGVFLNELLIQWPSYVAYFAAFLVIGVVWLTHHALFSKIRFSSTRLMLHNLLHLLVTSVIPFAAAVVSSAFRDGSRDDQLVGVIFFAIVSAALSLSWISLTHCVTRAPQLLINPDNGTSIRDELRSQPIALIPPIIAVGIAAVNPLWGLIVFAVSPVYYLTTILRAERRQAQQR